MDDRERKIIKTAELAIEFIAEELKNENQMRECLSIICGVVKMENEKTKTLLELLRDRKNKA